MERKRNLASNQQPQHQRQLLQQQTVIPPPPVPTVAAQPVTGPKPQQTPPPTPPLAKVKKSRTFSEVVFRRKESSQQTTTATPMDTIPQANRPDPSPRSSQQDMIPRSPRRNTAASTSSSATWSSAESRNSMTGYDNATGLGLPGAVSRTDTGFSSVTTVSRHNTSLSTMSSMSTASTIAPITKYGGFCKNAYELREGLIKKGLSLAPVGVYGRTMAYKCASSKCQFMGQALHDKKGYRINDKVFTAPSGLQYRWMFLAKSHMQQQEPRSPSFRCLVCLMLGDDLGIYHGHNVLLAHLVTHQRALLAETRLEGPLIFTNSGVKATDPELEFDIKFPNIGEHSPFDPGAGDGAAVVVTGRLPDGPNMGGVRQSKVQDVSSSKGPTAFAYEADDNPWA